MADLHNHPSPVRRTPRTPDTGSVRPGFLRAPSLELAVHSSIFPVTFSRYGDREKCLDTFRRSVAVEFLQMNHSIRFRDT